jgi:hypothetical protein
LLEGYRPARELRAYRVPYEKGLRAPLNEVLEATPVLGSRPPLRIEDAARSRNTTGPASGEVTMELVQWRKN